MVPVGLFDRRDLSRASWIVLKKSVRGPIIGNTRRESEKGSPER